MLESCQNLLVAGPDTARTHSPLLTICSPRLFPRACMSRCWFVVSCPSRHSRAVCTNQNQSQGILRKAAIATSAARQDLVRERLRHAQPAESRASEPRQRGVKWHRDRTETCKGRAGPRGVRQRNRRASVSRDRDVRWPVEGAANQQGHREAKPLSKPL